MATIEDVRKALWNGYRKVIAADPAFYGKSQEASCSVEYRSIWEADSEGAFCEPCCLVVYSYALGPSRNHYFVKGDEDYCPNYYTWVSKGIFGKAVEVINEWVEDYLEDLDEDGVVLLTDKV